MHSLNKTARWTGFGYLIIFMTGVFANFFVLEGMVVEGDAVATAANIATNLFTFRWGVFSFLIMVIVDVLLAGPLYSLLEHVDRQRAQLSSWLRLVNGTIFGVALFNLFGIIDLLESAPAATSDNAANVMQFLSAFDQTWLVGLIFFGLHLLILGHLVARSQNLPRWIGVLLQIAGLGYLADSFAQLLLPVYTDYQMWFEMIVLIPGILGEFSLTLWLLIKGSKTPE